MLLKLAANGEQLLGTPPKMWVDDGKGCRCSTLLRDKRSKRVIPNYWRHAGPPALYLIPEGVRAGVAVEFTHQYYSDDSGRDVTDYWIGHVVERTDHSLVLAKDKTRYEAVTANNANCVHQIVVTGTQYTPGSVIINMTCERCGASGQRLLVAGDVSWH
jgi:hypothetical protein